MFGAFSHSPVAGSNRTSNRLFCQYFAFITYYAISVTAIMVMA